MSDQNKQIMARNIKLQMERKGVTNQQLCDDLGFKYTTFMDWIKAVTYPRIGKVEAMANYFGCEKSDLIEDKGDSRFSSLPTAFPVELSKLKRIPILGRIPAGAPMYAEEYIEGYTYTNLNGGYEYFGLKVRGDSMDAAGIKDGYTVIVRRQDTVDNGQIAVVLINGEDATLKRFSQNGNIVTLMPQSTNPIHQPFIFDLKDTHVDILGLVVRVEFSPV